MALIQEEQEKSDILKMQLGEALKNYYIDELTELLIDIDQVQLKTLKLSSKYGYLETLTTKKF